MAAVAAAVLDGSCCGGRTETQSLFLMRYSLIHFLQYYSKCWTMTHLDFLCLFFFVECVRSEMLRLTSGLCFRSFFYST